MTEIADGPTLVIKPKNQIRSVDEVWAFLSVDEKDNTEGIIGMMTPNGWLPLIAADAERLTKLLPYAQDVATATNTAVKLVKFAQREDVKILEPNNQQDKGS